MLSGVREAVRALCTLAGDGEEAASAAAAQVNTDAASKRRLVRATASSGAYRILSSDMW